MGRWPVIGFYASTAVVPKIVTMSVISPYTARKILLPRRTRARVALLVEVTRDGDEAARDVWYERDGVPDGVLSGINDEYQHERDRAGCKDQIARVRHTKLQW